jgi:hypothetical protein
MSFRNSVARDVRTAVLHHGVGGLDLVLSEVGLGAILHRSASCRFDQVFHSTHLLLIGCSIQFAVLHELIAIPQVHFLLDFLHYTLVKAG